MIEMMFKRFAASILLVASMSPSFATAGDDYEMRLLSKAAPDECYIPIEVKETYEAPIPYIPLNGETCQSQTIAKVNQAYVWGLAKTKNDLWFGTAPNVNCLVEGTFLGSTNPSENESWACEFGDSAFKATFAPALPDSLGDWRPSKIYRLSLRRGSSPVEIGSTMSVEAKALLNRTIGLRSAGSHKDVVLFAGPTARPNAAGVAFFAFNAKTGAFLAAQEFPEYNNIRKWLVAKGEMYTAVGVNPEGDSTTRGALLKWTGDIRNPIRFDTVATLPSEGAELVEHDGKIVVATWPYISQQNPMASVPAGVYESAKLPSKRGLLPSTNLMTRIWSATDYEPDRVIALSYGGGALASFKGALVWGTMHVPGVATGLHFGVYGSAYGQLTGDQDQARLIGAIATQRAIAIFSKKTNQPTELLYGRAFLPVFDPEDNPELGWTIAPNASNLVPKLGLSGFGNPFNNYTWTMATNKQHLFVGTMDWGFLVYGNSLEAIADVPLDGTRLQALVATLPAETPEPLKNYLTEIADGIVAFLDQAPPVTAGDALINDMNIFAPGADLMVFDSLSKPAKVISRTGVGNYLNYGIRTMIADGDTLYLGSANPMNLRTEGEFQGGWELIKLYED
jgi:hypothetical protein